jgi:DNA-binding LacI/PurR family transcriptional regulator
MGRIARSPSRNVTSIDVARRAGVSQTTVSLVLSGKGAGRISAGTAEAVQRAASELGYRPNAAPASLRGPGAPPVVVVESEAYRLPNVRLDVEAGTDAALAHLHELGHRRIGLLRSEVRGETFDRRHVRWAEHLRANGQDPDDQVVVETRFTAKATMAAAREWLARRGDTTAVLCDDDVIAAGMLAAAQAEGVDVPRELSVIGFDDLDLTRLTSPALTTVATDPEGLGAAAFELLHARLQGKRLHNRVLPVGLVVRASTAPALRK